VARDRPDHQRIAVPADPPQFGDAAEVDDGSGGSQALLHRGDEGLPAGDQLCIFVIGEKIDRVRNRGRLGVSEVIHALGLSHELRPINSAERSRDAWNG